ncbi:uncharacterized protein [Musca autumnalis]|uniref:uncharacterized protein n=1 Tax=Musca autumnalis TaxID=221902 RepID=UPI003CF1D54F
MTTVNCVQSPISSCKTSLSQSAAINPKIASCFSSFCIKSGLVLNENISIPNPPNPSTNSYLPQQVSPKIPPATSSRFFGASSQCQSQQCVDSYPDCPVNVSLLATVYGSYKEEVDSMFLTNDANVALDEDFLSNEHQEKVMIDSIHNQQTSSSNADTNEDDEKTLKLAVELTMLNLRKVQSPLISAPSLVINKPLQENHSQSTIHPSPEQSSAISNPYRMTTKVFLQTQSRNVLSAATSLNKQLCTGNENSLCKTSSLTDINQTMISSVISEERSKKSQNMTECVPVPSSEHVAEIVGRQGCKIKALRAKTNTYIKTPVRNEEPVFVVTGRKEDVTKAKLEILSAAEHFTVIRASRRINDNVPIHSPTAGNKQQILGLHKTHGSTGAQTPGQVTVQVRVPYRLVGLVVGTKGNTIKHIQHETQTYIVTPSRDKEPIFEVTGLADNVELAKRHIEIHIATRLGSTKNNSVATSISPPSPCTTVRQSVDMDSTESSLHSLNALNHMLNDDLHSEILSSIYKNGICSTLDCRQIHLNGVNADDKCNNIHSMNGYFNDDIDRPSPYVLNEQINNQLKCVDFVNNLIETNSSQYCSEQRTQFT